jgi:hypothetical protein
VHGGPVEPCPASQAAVTAAGAPDQAAHLTPGQVAALLGGEVIGSYPDANSPAPVAYGPRDAATVLMTHGHRVALRDGAYVVDGERLTPGVLEQLAAGLEPLAGRPGALTRRHSGCPPHGTLGAEM